MPGGDDQDEPRGTLISTAAVGEGTLLAKGLGSHLTPLQRPGHHCHPWTTPRRLQPSSPRALASGFCSSHKPCQRCLLTSNQPAISQQPASNIDCLAGRLCSVLAALSTCSSQRAARSNSATAKGTSHWNLDDVQDPDSLSGVAETCYGSPGLVLVALCQCAS